MWLYSAIETARVSRSASVSVSEVSRMVEYHRRTSSGSQNEILQQNEISHRWISATCSHTRRAFRYWTLDLYSATLYAGLVELLTSSEGNLTSSEEKVDQSEELRIELKFLSWRERWLRPHTVRSGISSDLNLNWSEGVFLCYLC